MYPATYFKCRTVFVHTRDDQPELTGKVTGRLHATLCFLRFVDTWRSSLGTYRPPPFLTAAAGPFRLYFAGITSVSVASHKGREEIVKMLIAANADVKIDSNNGSTPLIQASHFGAYYDVWEATRPRGSHSVRRGQRHTVEA